MSKAAELVLTWLGYFAAAVALLFLVAASGFDLLRELDRWREERMSKKSKRLSVKIGQPIEVEYDLVSPAQAALPDIELRRVLAYNGAVCIDVLPLLRECAGGTVKRLVDRCAEAENIAAIPFAGG